MQRSKPRILPLIIAFVVIILVIIAVVSIGRALFAPSNESSKPVEDNGRASLLKTNVGRSVRLTTRGPIVADENFSSYTIEISPNSRVMNVYTGYVDQIKDSTSIANNTAAYEQFVYALDKAAMMNGAQPKDEAADDLRGVCATGYVYDYAVLVDGSVVKHLWTSTCDGSKGTLQASTSQLNSLFLAQIPDSGKLVPFRQNSLSL